ncbi:MAG TPA: hypothetical protein VGO84_16540 [Burkholderiales bacterium]|nr:hypothetical protein [Burkholderiales bacterium]
MVAIGAFVLMWVAGHEPGVAALNISTYIALYNYGYRNVYELRDALELSASSLEFEKSSKR